MDTMDNVDHEDIFIRLLIFIMAGLYAGLPALVWALRSLYRHRGGGGRVSVFIISLLLSDFLELALSPAVITTLLRSPLYRFRRYYCGQGVCDSVYLLFEVAKFCGLHFHQLVALEWILSLKHPLCCSTRPSLEGILSLKHPLCCSTRPPSLSCCVSLTVWLFVTICQFFGPIGLPINLVLCLVPTGILAVTCVLTCRAPPSSDHAPYTARRPGLTVLVVAMVALIILYGPLLSVGYMWFLDVLVPYPVWITAVSISSLRVIADPLLCVLVCRENPRRQTPQTDTELQN